MQFLSSMPFHFLMSRTEFPNALHAADTVHHILSALRIRWITKNRENRQTYALHNLKIPWSQSAIELYWQSNRRLSEKLLPTFADRGCHVVSVTDPYGCILGFLDRSRFFYQLAPQLDSRGWVDPIPDPLLLRKSGSAGNLTRTSCLQPGALTTEAVYILLHNIYKFSFVPHRKHNTSPSCIQELWPLDHRGGQHSFT
jgi:hypothetical protein